MNPLMQFYLQMMSPKSAGNVQGGAPASSGGGSDIGSAALNMIGQLGAGYGNYAASR